MEPSLEDTQPLELGDLPTAWWEIPDFRPLEAWSQTSPVAAPVVYSRPSEPCILRGIAVSIIGLTMLVALRDNRVTLLPLMNLYIGFAPLLLAWWIRGSVTPTTKKRSVAL